MEDQLDKIFYQIRMLYLNAIFTWIVLVVILYLIFDLPRRVLDHFLNNVKIEMTFGGPFGTYRVKVIPDKSFKSKGAGGNGGKGKKNSGVPGQHDKDTV